MRHFHLRRFDLLVSLGCLTLLGYFGWYAMEGSRGLVFRDRLMGQQASLQVELTKVQTARQALEQRVVLLRPENVDLDLADELARRSLSMAKRNELVVVLPQ